MELIEHLSNGIKDCLAESAIKGEMIEVKEYHRQIGKTHALISFAKSYGFNVVVHSEDLALKLIRSHDYSKIHGQTSIVSGNCVTDEGVDLEKLKHKNVKVITGFVTVY